MDGIAATQAIRRIFDPAALPILAMTANAFDEDRQRCLAAGMNDHIGKPVDPENLYATLLRWLPTPAKATDSPTENVSAKLADDEKQRVALSRIPDLEIAIGLKLMRGNLAKYVHLLNTFAIGHADDVDVLRAHLGAGEKVDADRMAHTLKGVAATLGAEKLRHSALALEMAIREPHALPEGSLEEHLQRLEAALNPLLSGIERALLAG